VSRESKHEKGAGSPAWRYTRPLVMGKLLEQVRRSAHGKRGSNPNAPALLAPLNHSRWAFRCQGNKPVSVGRSRSGFRSGRDPGTEAMFMTGDSNFWGAALLCCGILSSPPVADESRVSTTRKASRDNGFSARYGWPKCNLGDPSIRLFSSCFSPQIAVGGLRYPLQLVVQR